MAPVAQGAHMNSISRNQGWGRGVCPSHVPQPWEAADPGSPAGVSVGGPGL